VGLHGCLKHSKSWFNPRSLDHSGQLEKTLGRLFTVMGNTGLFAGLGWGSNPQTRVNARAAFLPWIFHLVQSSAGEWANR
jgi:hypothetical protein